MDIDEDETDFMWIFKVKKKCEMHRNSNEGGRIMELN